MPGVAPTTSPSIDNLTARNNTKVFILVNGARVGRIQSVRLDQSNNVQVLDEIGRDVAAELKKGITHYTFSVARFFTRNDVFQPLRRGRIFALMLMDTAGLNPDGTGQSGTEVLENFQQCMIQSVSFDYTNGAATIGMNATIVTIGAGLDFQA